MLSKIIILAIIVIVLIAFDFKRNKNLKKSIIASLLLIYSLVIFDIGFITKPIFLLFILNVLFFILSMLAIVLYIFREKLYIWVYILPLANIALLFILNFLDGARYH